MVAALNQAYFTFGIHDSRLCLANVSYTHADSTITEASLGWESDPDSGNFTFAGGAPVASPVLSGSATATATLTVDAVTGGRVGTGAYTYTDSSSVVWGRTPIERFTAMETINGNFAGPGNYDVRHPRAKTLPDGSIGIVFDAIDPTDGIRFTRRTARDTYSTPVLIRTFASAPTEDPHPELWLIPASNTSSAILFVGYWDELDASTQVWTWHTSQDNGATWSAAQVSSLTITTTGPAEAQWTSVVYEPLTRDLILGTRRNGGNAEFWRSIDLGQTWIAQPGLTIADVLVVDMVTTCGSVHLMYTENSGAPNTLQYRTKPTSDAATWSTAVQIDNDGSTDMAATITPDGWLRVVYGTDVSTSLATSTDGGATWTSDSVSSQGAGGDGIILTGTAYTTGSLVTVGNDASVNAGYSLVSGDESNVQFDVVGTAKDYYAFELPATMDALNYAYSGGSTQSIGGDSTFDRVYRIDNTNADGYVQATSGDGWVWRIGKDSAGGSTAASDLVLRVASQNGISDAVVEIRLDMTTRKARLYDVVAASNLGSEVGAWAAGDVEFALAVDGVAGKASAWYRAGESNQWLPIAVNQTVNNGGAVAYGGRWGKINATTANIDFQWWRHFTPDGHATNTQETIPITTTGYTSDRILPGAKPRWVGSPVMVGDRWTWSTFSPVGIGRALPTSQTKSASLTWQSGTGAAGRSERVVFDCGATYKGKLSDNIIYIGADNATGVESIVLQRWDGAAWQTVQTLTLGTSPFGGTVDWTRDSATSVCIRPNGANGTSRLYKRNELAGLWMSLTDGVDTAMVRIIQHTEGQFTTTTGALPLVLDVDAANAITVAGGGWASLAQSSSGTVKVYHSRGMVEGVQSAEATRYYAMLITLAPGFTTASIGVLSAGAAVVSSRAPRAGSSLRLESPFRMTEASGGAGSSVRRAKRVGGRTLELPWDQQLIFAGQYYDGTLVNTGSPDGIAKRFTLESIAENAMSFVRDLGDSMPVFVSIARVLPSDWATSAKSSYGHEVIQGFVSSSIDYVVALEQMRGNGSSANYGGLQLGIRENV